jgi:hypothetical protein
VWGLGEKYLRLPDYANFHSQNFHHQLKCSFTIRMVNQSTASIEPVPEPAFVMIVKAKSDSGTMIERQKNVPAEPSNPEYL